MRPSLAREPIFKGRAIHLNQMSQIPTKFHAPDWTLHLLIVGGKSFPFGKNLW
ncbi:hypothetical protein RP20_CCG001554 [Aedes albopictus]|nr:hypothetical protein RP20_CCG001554 [Aedes albopictus]